jgi:hypothetical protein
VGATARWIDGNSDAAVSAAANKLRPSLRRLAMGSEAQRDSTDDNTKSANGVTAVFHIRDRGPVAQDTTLPGNAIGVLTGNYRRR